MPRSEVFSSDFLPAQTTTFEPASGVFQYGVEYVYLISLIDAEGANAENRSGAQSQPFRYVLPGDFNADGTVDAADYVTWRKGVGIAPTPENYNLWRGNFGASLGLGSGAADPLLRVPAATVPEPASLALLLLVLGGFLLASRHRVVAKNCC